MDLHAPTTNFWKIQKVKVDSAEIMQFGVNGVSRKFVFLFH